jgi:ABC-type uncharacterized transport system permease subunit
MPKKYKPSIKEMIFVFLIIAFVAVNIVLRSLFINSDADKLSFDNIFSLNNVIITSIELAVFIVLYILWDAWEKFRGKRTRSKEKDGGSGDHYGGH